MADTQGARRSGRTRHQTKSYAEEQATATAPPAKRKRAAPKTSKTKRSKDAPGDDGLFNAEAVDADTEKPREKAKAKAVKPVQADDEADLPGLKAEDPEDDGEFKPVPKKTKKANKRVKEIGKLDSQGVMRLDTTEKRPPGEKRPPRVYEIPAKVKGPKDKSFNLAAILAESFEGRWEGNVSKIPRLPPGAPEVRIKE